MGRILSVLALVFLLLVLISVGAAQLQVYKGDSMTVQDANSTITWGQNYTFNVSMLTEHSDGIEIGAAKNISLTSNTAEPINSTLWKYDLSGISDGKQLVRIGTSAVSGPNVQYEFTDIPPIEFGNYVLKLDGSQYTNFSSGGTLSWNYDNWNSDHNFTLTYQNTTSEANIPPVIEINGPDQINKDVSGGVELEVTVGDVNGDNMDITFYDGNSDKIDEVTGVGNGTYTVTWNSLNPDQTYDWEVEVADGSTTVVSDAQSFTTIDLKLSWNDTSKTESGFRIYSNATGSWNKIKTTGKNTESFTDVSSSLEFGTQTCYRVTSYNKFGESPPLEGCTTP